MTDRVFCPKCGHPDDRNSFKLNYALVDELLRNGLTPSGNVSFKTFLIRRDSHRYTRSRSKLRKPTPYFSNESLAEEEYDPEKPKMSQDWDIADISKFLTGISEISENLVVSRGKKTALE